MACSFGINGRAPGRQRKCTSVLFCFRATGDSLILERLIAILLLVLILEWLSPGRVVPHYAACLPAPGSVESAGGNGPAMRRTCGILDETNKYAEALRGYPVGRLGRETHPNEGLAGSKKQEKVAYNYNSGSLSSKVGRRDAFHRTGHSSSSTLYLVPLLFLCTVYNKFQENYDV